jgi:flavodoxin
MSQKLVIYDSVFGNTEKIALAIGEALENAPVKRVTVVAASDLENLEVLIIGSPTRAFRPTPAIMDFLKNLPPNALKSVKAAAFDTRIPFEKVDSGFLRFMIKLFGYADEKIAKKFEKAGAYLALKSTGFGVKDTEGPLVDDELERAKNWASTIL